MSHRNLRRFVSIAAVAAGTVVFAATAAGGRQLTAREGAIAAAVVSAANVHLAAGAAMETAAPAMAEGNEGDGSGSAAKVGATLGGHDATAGVNDTDQEALTPRTFAYQGILKTPAGKLETGWHDMKFAIFDAVIGGAELYCEEIADVPVTEGLYNVVLGDVGKKCGSDDPVSGIGEQAFAGRDRYLAIWVDGQELLPRQRAHPVPWAMLAETAILAENSKMAETLRAGAIIEGSVDSNYVLRVKNSGKYAAIQGVGALDAGVEGFILDCPNAQDCVGPLRPGVLGVSRSADNTNYGSRPGVHGVSGSGYGVLGSAAGSGIGVRGSASSGNGVEGSSETGIGVYGHSAIGDAITGRTAGTAINVAGVYGEGAAGSSAGVYGVSKGDGHGVYGRSDGGGWSGFFQGNVKVAATLNADKVDTSELTAQRMVLDDSSSRTQNANVLRFVLAPNADAMFQGPKDNTGGTADWLKFDRSHAGTGGIGNLQNIVGYAPFAVSSDRRAKTDIESIGSVLDRVTMSRAVRYRRAGGTHTELGVIAQELQVQFPELVVGSEPGRSGPLAVDYGGLAAVAIEAIKELDAENRKLRGQNKILQQELDALNASTADLQRNMHYLMHRLDTLERTWQEGPPAQPNAGSEVNR